MSTGAPACRTCRFWTGASCHRYPPQLAPWESASRQTWPETKPDDWCGEWVKGLR